VQPHNLIVPFPFREKSGNIRYYCQGSGWYWTPEVRAALACYGDRITIDKAFIFETKELRPFHWIDEIAAKRLTAKRAGLASEKVYKLGMNSVYGKCAQGGSSTYKHRPPFQSYVWAGLITSGTRAQLLTEVFPHRDIVIGCATDGILFLADPHIPEGDKLGDWERTEYSELLYLQNGIYFGDAARVVRTRGHHSREVDYDTLLAGWRDRGVRFVHPYESRRFIGMGTALHRNDDSLWRTWHTENRELKCLGGSKFVLTEALEDSDVEYVTLYPWRDPWHDGTVHASGTYKSKHREKPTAENDSDMILQNEILHLEQPTL
jgi:hypothetical protein